MWSVYVILIAMVAALVGCTFMMSRNAWVYSKRSELIWTDWDAYQRLPSYDAMLWRVWVWDINKFLGGDA